MSAAVAAGSSRLGSVLSVLEDPGASGLPAQGGEVPIATAVVAFLAEGRAASSGVNIATFKAHCTGVCVCG